MLWNTESRPKLIALIIVIVIVLGLVMVAGFEELPWQSSDNKIEKETDIPTWRSGHTWVYGESVTTGSGAVYTYIDHISEITQINGNPYYTHSTLEMSNEERVDRLDDRLFSSSSLNEAVEGQGGVLRTNFIDYSFPLRDGKTWPNAGTSEGYSGVYSVTTGTAVITQAGAFNCFQIIGDLVKEDGDRTIYQTRTIFYSSEVKRHVKTTVETETYDDGEIVDRWVVESVLIDYGFEDIDQDNIADKIEESFLSSDPRNPDADGDGVTDDYDIIPSMDMHLRVTISHFETQDNDQYDNGLNPTECDPYFIIELKEAYGGSNSVFVTYETEHFQDQNVVNNLVILIDIDDCQTFEHYGNMEKLFYIDILAYDDDENDTTNTDGEDDEVNINDDDGNGVCKNSIFLIRGEIMNLNDQFSVKEGESLTDFGTDSDSIGDNTKGGSIEYTFEIVDKP